MNTTLPSLLERLRQPVDQEAWERFVHLYTPLLCRWARKVGAPAPEVGDVVQDVFAVLVHKLPEFRYDPSQRFRGWLWTITVNKWYERCRKQQPELQADLAETVVADGTEAIGEEEYRQYLMRRAFQIMEKEFQPATWKAFWESAIEERPGAEVAAELGMTIDAVYAAKSRVLRRLREELAGLLD
jgi:RNA polymerase sigma-70 factor (ECF subfamily)